MATNWSEEVARAWRGSAPFWAKNSDTVRAMFEPVTTELMRSARIGAGDRVLDVAGGPGEPSLTIATAIGLAGRIVHTDLASGMADAARAEAGRRGLSNAAFVLASGDALPFADDSFDRVVSRFGLMFLPDVERGIAEMLRTLRPGGSLCVAVWGAKERNPYFTIPADIAAGYAPSPATDDARDMWQFGRPRFVADLFELAGAVHVVEHSVPFSIAAALDFDEFWVVRVELSDTLRDRVGTLAPEERRDLSDDLRHATLPYFADGTMRFPAEAVIVCASKA